MAPWPAGFAKGRAKYVVCGASDWTAGSAREIGQTNNQERTAQMKIARFGLKVSDHLHFIKHCRIQNLNFIVC
jgi:hypothetical protein